MSDVAALPFPELVQAARQAEHEGDLSLALQHWRDVLGRIPAGHPDSQILRQHMVEISRALEGEGPFWRRWWRRLRALGPVGVLLAALGKLKFLLLGLSKIGTILSMLAMFAIYARFWGWRFALGFVLLIYVHEMGHVATLRRYGIRATAPMFIPFLGAFIRLKQYPTDPREDARAGLAGPLWGTVAAVACWVWGVTMHSDLAIALAAIGGWINLFNLLPVWTLDGARGFVALGRLPRWTVVAAFAAAWLWSHQGLLLILAAVAAFRAASKGAASAPTDNLTWFEFIALIAVLAPLAALRVAM